MPCVTVFPLAWLMHTYTGKSRTFSKQIHHSVFLRSFHRHRGMLLRLYNSRSVNANPWKYYTQQRTFIEGIVVRLCRRQTHCSRHVRKRPTGMKTECKVVPSTGQQCSSVDVDGPALPGSGCQGSSSGEQIPGSEACMSSLRWEGGGAEVSGSFRHPGLNKAIREQPACWARARWQQRGWGLYWESNWGQKAGGKHGLHRFMATSVSMCDFQVLVQVDPPSSRREAPTTGIGKLFCKARQ